MTSPLQLPAFRAPEQVGGVDTQKSPAVFVRHNGYEVRLATLDSEREAAYRLRFLVFNLELQEGLASAFSSGHDNDEFDQVCDHLIVEQLATSRIVGTYRLQTGLSAGANRGYYSEREFRFECYEPLRNKVIELGRACIHRNHRSSDVLNLLWRGIAQYALRNRSRYLIGCSSLSSQDSGEGWAAYERLRRFEVAQDRRTNPQPSFQLDQTCGKNVQVEIPKLLRTYLAIGSQICGPPAIDREFKTIDFLTLLDLEELHPRVWARFFER